MMKTSEQLVRVYPALLLLCEDTGNGTGDIVVFAVINFCAAEKVTLSRCTFFLNRSVFSC